ncbi:mitochondrial carrier [Dacryopinax primogenitus]|uniref:Mitochondrial carrier n=1 Tax=Dacryopinax primogenitus (strain DJM 731) TaxID=1858805 RepID=M5G2D8_DACPD|nr:mitochondrial carrier [Dacryopinax primogenitus]EJT97932.1 mitochondrial carrier [Dacryopinax primogenitus]
MRARTIAAASGATMTSLTMTPFDVIKTRLQTQSSGAPRPPSLLFPYPPRPCASCAPAPTPVSCALAPHAARPLSSFSVSLASVGNTGRHTTASCTWDVGWVGEERVGGAVGKRVAGFWDGVGRIAQTEGVGALWKGVGTTLIMSVPAQTLYMLTYSNLLLTLPPSPTFTPLAAGMLSRTLITTLFSPLELVRTRLQATPPPGAKRVTLAHTLAHLRESVQVSGMSTLWRGLAPSLWRDVPFSGVYWLLQHNITLSLAPQLPNYLLGAPLAFVSGFGAGSLASLLTNPFDVLKTRRQTAALPVEMGTIRAITSIARREGARALWVGVGPRTAKIAPACGIMIACYEGVARLVP